MNMKKVVFMGLDNDPVHVIYDGISQKRYFFQKSGGSFAIPEYLADKLIANFPKKFGESVEAIKIARGVTILKVKKSTNKKFTAKSKHPFVKSMANVDGLRVEKDGKLPKVEKRVI